MKLEMSMSKKPRTMAILSGGLDSTVSIAYLKNKYDIKYAITFDYGQRAVKNEIEASAKICEHYEIKHIVVELPWLKDITTTALVNTDEEIPEPDINLDTTEAMKAVWVPNRNGVFLNIAASYCEHLKIDYVIFGANKEEAATFPDNSKQFIVEINNSLRYSTLQKVEVLAPLIDLDKEHIVKLAARLNVPFELIMSCYTDEEKHCGKCESCKRFKNALSKAGLFDTVKKVFGKNA
jgi:7-cyano-7-deazaguanine synthase